MRVNRQIESYLNRASKSTDSKAALKQRTRPNAPYGNVRTLADAGLLDSLTPARFGGTGAGGADLRKYTEILASACGVTTFNRGSISFRRCSLQGGK